MVTPYMKNEDIVVEFRRDWSSNLFDVYDILHNIEVKEQGIYKPILHFSTIFQQVANEMLDSVTYQQIMDKIGDEAPNEDGLTIDEKFTEDFDIGL